LFVTYTAFGTIISIPLSIFYLSGLALIALKLNSTIMVLMIIVNTCGFLTVRIFDEKKTMFKMFLLFLIGSGMLFVIGKFSMEVYFDILRRFMEILPGFIANFWKTLIDEEFTFPLL
jgi:hypothetical protein